MDQIEKVPRAQREALARGKLKQMAVKLIALSDNAHGELAVEARRAWLLADMPLRTPAELERVLELVGGVVAFVDNWSDCASGREETKEEESDRYSSAYGMAKRLAEGVRRGREPVDLRGENDSHDEVVAHLEAAAKYLEKKWQASRREEEPQREKDAEAFENEFMDPAIRASHAAQQALFDLVDVGVEVRTFAKVMFGEGCFYEVRDSLSIACLREASAAGLGAFLGVATDGVRDKLPRDVTVAFPGRGELDRWRAEREGKVVHGRRWFEVKQWEELRDG